MNGFPHVLSDDNNIHTLSFPGSRRDSFAPELAYDFFTNHFLTIIEECQFLILDLTGVQMLNSFSLTSIIRCHQMLEGKQGKLAVCGIHSSLLAETFALTRFDKVLHMYQSLSDARKSFG